MIQMEKAVMLGAGETGKRIYSMAKKEYQIIGVVDNDSNKWGKQYLGMTVKSVPDIKKMGCNCVVIGNLVGVSDNKIQLREMGLKEEHIISKYVESSVWSRIGFLKNTAQLCYEKNMDGAIAEVGVYQGEFAKMMNVEFPDKKFYLFDTFEGFYEEDVYEEIKNNFSEASKKDFGNTTVDLVLSKMQRKENCIVKKGYFPETAEGLLEERFAFVNLDVDLYKPTLEALRFFYPRMVPGGIILIHDYFPEVYRGVKQAVKEFQEEIDNPLIMFPIGDEVSLGIMAQ